LPSSKICAISSSFPDNPYALVIVRDFSSALAHGTATALTGIALGAFVVSTERSRGILPLLVGLLAAMTLHFLWNNFAYFSTFDRASTEWTLVGVGLAGVALVAATILWGYAASACSSRDAWHEARRVG
jgi:RsiW-degrading membrane proteinase PrsW (M82 family)